MEPKYTPSTIKDARFVIPIYQRLFEWEDKQIKQLLVDLFEGFSNAPAKPYFIGMLTSKTNVGETYELVDGQQRFTVTMLMGIIMQRYSDEWKNFIKPTRLSFSARPEDQDYMCKLIKHYALSAEEYSDSEYENDKMKKGLRTISSFVLSLDDDKRATFSAYVYSHLTFFVSVLPKDYNAAALNKYFERMNSTGKNLEGHEILKVRILGNSKFPAEKRELYTRLWNRVSEMDSPLFDVRDYLRSNKENTDGLKVRIKTVLKTHDAATILRRNPNDPAYALLNGLGTSVDASGSGNCIKDLPVSPDEPKKTDHFGTGSRSVMNFTELLLQVLYYFYGESIKDDKQIVSFFNPSNLVANFENILLNNGDGDAFVNFLDRLLRARVILDVYFIRISENDEDMGYSLELPVSHGEGDERLAADKLRMYESMLYVSSAPVTYYRWFKMLMDCVYNTNDAVSTSILYKHFVEGDNIEHPKSDIESIDRLGYKQPDNRYWFWRLDYCIWLKRAEIFKDNEKARKVADRYVFRRNRSIEHIAPQTPQQDATLKWDESMHGFGNLVMISSDQNSSLKNSVYQEKKGRVESHIEESRTGTIESLKLLLAFTMNKTWNLETIAQHGDRSHKLLLESYSPEVENMENLG